MRFTLFFMLAMASFAGLIQPAAAQSEQRDAQSRQSAVQAGLQDKVVVRGTVPNEAARAAILKRLRGVFGADMVVDRIEIGQVYAPPQWSKYVTKLLDPSLKQISNGQLQVDGNSVRLTGSVDNEAQLQKILSKAAESLNATYTIKNALAVDGHSVQDKLYDLLDRRTVNFESGSAIITANGRRLLNKIAAILRKAGSTQILIAGHTDNIGQREANVQLSIERASAVKAYLVKHGVDASMLAVMGYGASQPVASNATQEGRAKNRRIEFTVQK